MKEKTGAPRNERKKMANHPKISPTPAEPTKGKLNSLNKHELMKLTEHLERNGQHSSRRFIQALKRLHIHR